MSALARMRMLAVPLLALALSGAFALTSIGCGGSVELLDVQDRSLPMETRRWLADAEDGVIVARAFRDRARETLREVTTWQDRIDDDLEWANNARGPERALEALAEARVVYANLALEHAEALVALSEAKLTLAHAERAMLHDLAQYDLPPLRAAVEEARRDATRRFTAAGRAKSAQERALIAWWDAYSSYVGGGGDRMSLWLMGQERINVTAERPRAPATGTTPAAGADGAGAAGAAGAGAGGAGSSTTRPRGR